MACELAQDVPMQERVDDGGGVVSLQQLVQPVRTNGGFGSACTFDMCTSRTSGAQEAVGVMGGTGLWAEGACDAGARAASPATERGGASTPSVRRVFVAAQSVRPSRRTETIETNLPGGRTDGQTAGWWTVRGATSRAFSRAASEVGGALRETRAAADAGVRRMRRLFFRDAG